MAGRGCVGIGLFCHELLIPLCNSFAPAASFFSQEAQLPAVFMLTSPSESTAYRLEQPLLCQLHQRCAECTQLSEGYLKCKSRIGSSPARSVLWILDAPRRTL